MAGRPFLYSTGRLVDISPCPVGACRRAPKHRRERNGYEQHRYISGVQIPSYDTALVRREREVLCREAGCGVPEYR